MKILEIQNLSYSIGSKTILKKVDLEILQGVSYVLRGDNGAGKSTLLKLILNHSFHKESIRPQGHLPMDRNLLSFLGHELGLYSSLTLEDNLKFFHEVSQSPYPWDKVLDWVEKCRLHRRWEDPVYSFSRGMKQKAALIRAVLVRPMLILLDEPFTGLDDKSYPIVLEILQEALQDSAILAVVHGLEDPFWQKRLSLEKGELVCS